MAVREPSKLRQQLMKAKEMSLLQPMRSRGEDYALQRVPYEARRSSTSVGQVALAIPTALVFLATGGSLWTAYGARALILGLIAASVIIGFAGYVLTSFACRSGLDSDLMSIWAGYGLRGSALASLIYSGNFIVLFAIEDSIVADAVRAHYAFLPRSAILLALGAVVLFLTWRGISRLSRVMALTLPFLVVLFIWALVAALGRTASTSFWSVHTEVGPNGVPAALAAFAALLAFTVNATVGADLGRFLRPQDRRRGAVLVGVVLQFLCFGVVMLLGAWLTYKLGGNTDPGSYLVSLAGMAGVVLVVISQIRINTINAYAGSLSLSNFGKRSIGVQPGRRLWMAALIAIATSLALRGIYSELLSVLTFEATFVTAWVATLVSYILLAPSGRQRAAGEGTIANLSQGIPSVIALVSSLVCAVPLAFGVVGDVGKVVAPILAIIVASVTTWALARLPLSVLQPSRQ
jgi:purine-cytosine permease-like protein